MTDSGTGDGRGRRVRRGGETEAGETGAIGRREKTGSGKLSCVEFQDACLRYPQASDEALTGISFTASAGETIGVIGGTGSGKTSLVNLIPAFFMTASRGRGAGGRAGTSGEYPLGETAGKNRRCSAESGAVLRGTIRQNLQWGKEGR